jgi:hypothetical protein
VRKAKPLADATQRKARTAEAKLERVLEALGATGPAPVEEAPAPVEEAPAPVEEAPAARATARPTARSTTARSTTARSTTARTAPARTATPRTPTGTRRPSARKAASAAPTDHGASEPAPTVEPEN